MMIGMQVKVNTDHLEMIFVDNKQFSPSHRKGYNGIAKLRTTQSLDEWNFFVDYYAGFNHEHYFDNKFRSHKDLYHPRRHPMSLLQEKDSKNTTHVKLTQKSYRPWNVRYDADFKIHGHSIDFTLQFTPQRELPSSEFLGVFFASYINQPEQKGFNLHTEGKWHYFETTAHGTQSSIASNQCIYHPTFSDKIEKHWLFASYAPIQYDWPVFYGINHGIMLCFMFESKPLLFLSHSPSGGGLGNPAWDFFIIQPKPQPHQTFSLRGRLIVKPFVSDSDVEAEYKSWTTKT
jgi:hypothetical protein